MLLIVMMDFKFFQTTMNVFQMKDWDPVLRYVPTQKDHSTAVVMLGILYLDIYAMVRSACLVEAFCILLLYLHFPMVIVLEWENMAVITNLAHPELYISLCTSMVTISSVSHTKKNQLHWLYEI